MAGPIPWLTRNDRRNLARIYFWLAVAFSIISVASVIAYNILNTQANTIHHCLIFNPNCTSTSNEEIADLHWADKAFGGMFFGIPFGIVAWLALLAHRVATRRPKPKHA